MSEESDDKQFDASESKLRKAREQGDIPRSAELQGALAYLGFWFAMLFAASWAVPGWVRMAARALGSEPLRRGRVDVDHVAGPHRFTGVGVILDQGDFHGASPLK